MPLYFKRSLPHDISICAAGNGGFIVNVGCQTFVYREDDKAQMVLDLREYISNPEAVIRAHDQYIQSKRNDPLADIRRDAPEPRPKMEAVESVPDPGAD